jgi:hypothetical protein
MAEADYACRSPNLDVELRRASAPLEIGMEWATPEYSRTQVDKAGTILTGDWKKTPRDDIHHAIEIAENWRSSHSYPLNTFQMTLRQKCKGIDAEAIVAQRLKRFISIIAKLDRFETMKLSQMQDIGGCRAVVSNIESVNALTYKYEKSRFNHTLRRKTNYILNPKGDGYRGVHLIYQYEHEKESVYNKMFVEIQIRTQLQHAWATAVEAVGTFTDQALKSNQGSAEWRRFFALMGSALAHKEGTAIIPDTPGDYKTLVDEIRGLERKLNVNRTLRAHRATLKVLGSIKDAKYFLLKLDPEDKETYLRSYTATQSVKANKDYIEEEEKSKGTAAQVVLVSVDSLQALTRAYPNYLMDTERFREALNQVIQ